MVRPTVCNPTTFFRSNRALQIHCRIVHIRMRRNTRVGKHRIWEQESTLLKTRKQKSETHKSFKGSPTQKYKSSWGKRIQGYARNEKKISILSKNLICLIRKRNVTETAQFLLLQADVVVKSAEKCSRGIFQQKYLACFYPLQSPTKDKVLRGVSNWDLQP